MPKKINIRAVYKNGSLTPLSPVDIEDGDVVSLTIEVEDKLSWEGLSKDAPAKTPTAEVWTTQEDLERIRRAVNGPKLSTDEWLEKVRKRKEKYRTRVTAAQILEARDADRK